jgi:hypothetical protein
MQKLRTVFSQPTNITRQTNMKRLLIALILILTLTSCRALLKAYFDEDPSDRDDTEFAPVAISKYNADNIVFKTNRTFTYKITFDSSTIKKVMFLKLRVLTGKFADQTKIRYKYCYSSVDTCQNRDLTGVYEDKKEIFLHPPRGSMFELFEFAPFYEIHFPLKVGKTWKESITTGRGWGKYQNIKTKTCYTIASQDPADKDLFYLTAKSESSLGISTLDYSFHKTKGFIKLYYQLFDGRKITFDLINTQD